MVTVLKYAGSVTQNTGWLNPEEALGAPDDTCAYVSSNKTLDLGDFGFSETQDPQQVLVNVKACINVESDWINVYIWKDDTEEWEKIATIIDEPPVFPVWKCEDSYWRGEIDVSDIITTKERLNAIQIRFVHSASGGGGGYGETPVLWTGYLDSVYIKAIRPEAEARIRRLLTRVGL